MSTDINNQVVQMTFDNKQFEKGAAQTMRTIDKLKVSLNFDGVKGGLSAISKQISTLPNMTANAVGSSVRNTFDHTWTVVDQFIRQMTNAVMSNVRQMTNQLNVFKGSLTTGFSEYETKINSVQTIWANTKDAGTSMSDIIRVLDELNTYADKTIYNFTEMTRNIGTFTAAGLGLEESSKAIQGIANLAAISGSTSTQASTAMYQLSQALAAGRVTLADWNSVVNAGMGGKVFQKVLIETAKEMGTISTELARGLENGTETFRNTLTEHGWITSDVLSAALTKFTDTETELGRTATEAATKVKTFTQLIDTLKESVQSGWTQSWEYIIGDFETSRNLFTNIYNAVSGMFQPSIDARNEMLKYWAGISDSDSVAKETLNELDEHQKEIEAIAKRVNMGEFGNGEERRNALESLGFNYEEVQNAVNALRGMAPEFDIVRKSEEEESAAAKKEMSGRDYMLKGLANSAEQFKLIFNTIRNGFTYVFKPITGEQLTELSKKFHDFTESMKPEPSTIKAIGAISKIIARAFKMVLKFSYSAFNGIRSGLETVLGTGVLDKLKQWIIDLEEDFWRFDTITLQNFDFWTKISDGVKIAVKALFNLPAIVKKVFNATKSYFASFEGLSPTKVLKKVFTDLSDAMKDLFDTAKSGSESTGPLSAFGDFSKSVLDFLSSLGHAFGGAGETTATAIDRFAGMISTLWEALHMGEFLTTWNPIDFLNAFGRALKRILEDLSLEDVKAVGLVMLFDQLRKLFKSLTGFGDSLTNVTSLMSKPLTNLLKTVNQNMRSIPQILMMLSVSVLSLAGAVLIFSKIDTGKLWGSIGALGAILTALMVCAAIIRKMQIKKEDAKYTETGYLPIIGMILSLVYAVQTLAIVAAGLAVLDSKLGVDVQKGVLLMGEILAGIMVAVVIIGLVTKLVNRSINVKLLTGSMIAMATAINLLILPVAALAAAMQYGILDYSFMMDAIKILAGLSLLLTAISVVLTATGHFFKEGSAIKGAIGMAIIAASITSMLIPIAGLAALDFAGAKVWEIIGQISLLVVAIGAVITAISVFAKGGDAVATGTAFAIVATSIIGIAYAIKMLAKIGTNKITVITKSLFKMVALIGVIVAVTSIVLSLLALIPGANIVIPVTLGLLAALVLSFALLTFGIASATKEITNLIEAVIEFAQADMSKFGKNVESLCDGIIDNSEKIGAAIYVFVKGLSDSITSLGGGIGSILGSLAGALIEMLNAFIIELVNPLIRTASILVYAVVKVIFAVLAAAIRGASEEIDDLVSATGDFLYNFGTALERDGSKIHDGCAKIMNGIGKCLFGEDFEGNFAGGFASFLALALGKVLINPKTALAVAAIGLGVWIIGQMIEGAKTQKQMVDDLTEDNPLEKSISELYPEFSKQGLTEEEITAKVNANRKLDIENTDSWIIGKSRYDTAVEEGETWIVGYKKGIENKKEDINKASKGVGEYTAEGLADGLKSGYDEHVKKAVGKTSDQTIGEYRRNLGIESPSTEGIAIGNFFMEGIRVGLVNTFNLSVRPALMNMSNQMISVTRRALDINSPSGAGMIIGNFFSQGVALGIKDGSKDVVDETDSMAQAIQDTLNNFLGETDMGAGIKDLFTTAGGILDIFKDGINKDTIKKAFNSVTDKFIPKNPLADLGLNTSLSPIVDVSSIQSQINGALSSATSMGLNDLNGSLTSKVTIDKIQNGSYDGTNVVTSVERLNAKMDAITASISSMQIRMDTGALVGSIAGPMDNALGKRAIYSGRGI